MKRDIYLAMLETALQHLAATTSALRCAVDEEIKDVGGEKDGVQLDHIQALDDAIDVTLEARNNLVIEDELFIELGAVDWTQSAAQVNAEREERKAGDGE
jgi:hypothetical protein